MKVAAICDRDGASAIEKQLAVYYSSERFCARQGEIMVEQIDLIMTFVSRYADPEYEHENFLVRSAEKMMRDMVEETTCLGEDHTSLALEGVEESSLYCILLAERIVLPLPPPNLAP